MQIVIDIPDRIYKMINAKYWLGSIDTDVLNKAIRIGTLLPKGHGRLIDADELFIDIEWSDIENAPTIIEADKEGEND